MSRTTRSGRVYFNEGEEERVSARLERLLRYRRAREQALAAPVIQEPVYEPIDFFPQEGGAAANDGFDYNFDRDPNEFADIGDVEFNGYVAVLNEVFPQVRQIFRVQNQQQRVDQSLASRIVNVVRASIFPVPLNQATINIPPFIIFTYAMWDLIKQCNNVLPPDMFQLSTCFFYYDDANQQNEASFARPLKSAPLAALLEQNVAFNREIFDLLFYTMATMLRRQIYENGVFVDSPGQAANTERLLTQGMTVRLVASCTFNRTADYQGRLRQYATVNLNNRGVLLREGRVNFANPNVVGDFGGKRKMIYRGSDAQFRHEADDYGDAIFKNPFYDGVYCFPMAFLLSQCRIFKIESGKITQALRTPPRVSAQPNMNYIKVPNLFEFDKPIPNCSFFRDNQLVLFNPQHVFEDQFEDWQDCGQALHGYVEARLHLNIDPTAWHSTPQAYADVFNVVIHIFIKGGKDRFDTYYPKQKPELSEYRHIYMYCDNGHFHPVVDIYKFVNSKIQYAHQWCDYCQKYFSPTYGQERCYEHINECHKAWEFISSEVGQFVKASKEYKAFTLCCKKQNSNEQLVLFCQDHKATPCECSPYKKQWTKLWTCKVCGEDGPYQSFSLSHKCYFQPPKPKEAIPNDKLFVLDIESMQYETMFDSNKLVHECVLVCVRNMYNADVRFECKTIKEFLHACQHQEMFYNTTFLAHNGGGYDYQFIVQELEAGGYEYSFVPRPNSDHKYLSLTVVFGSYSTVTFIDFISLMPGSLKGIAMSFQLEVQKGDFPHKFLNPNTLNYVGAFPPIDSEVDFFSLEWKKSSKDIEEVRTWHAQMCEKYCTCAGVHCCDKPLWNCYEFLREYCWLDVDVLASACAKYRDLLMNVEQDETLTWQAKPTDPFRFLTQSQLAMHIFLTGFNDFPKIGISIPRKRRYKHWKQFVWFHRLQMESPEFRIIHFGNSQNEYYFVADNIYFSGYCQETRTVYEFQPSDQPEINEERQDILENLRLKRFVSSVVYMREEDLLDITEEEKELAQVSEDREFFFGGRTEVFSPYANADICDMMIKYLDVCSLYPTMCSFKMVPTGHPTIFFGPECRRDRLNPNHSDPYFGYVRCKVKPNPHDMIGLLPCKTEEDKLVFSLEVKTGMWFTEEIYLALENGYEILQIYEVHHFDKDNRSDTLMRGYMEYFLRMKQESEGWVKLGASSAVPSMDEIVEVADNLYRVNGNIARIRPSKVHKNPVMRQVAKIFLNCLWGKFCQRQKATYYTEMTSLQDFEALLSLGEEMDGMFFRQMKSGRWRVKYDKPTDSIDPNKKYNIYLAAAVTAQARCYLHRQMIKIGPDRILYCDTDSIIFLYNREGPNLAGIGLGSWTDEYPNEEIKEFMAIAPKCYMLKMSDGDETVKAKGCVMSHQNKTVLTADAFKKLIDGFCVQKRMDMLQLKNFSIFTNSNDINYPYATMFSRYNEKSVRCVLTKRVIMADLYQENENCGEEIGRINMMPYGFISNPS